MGTSLLDIGMTPQSTSAALKMEIEHELQIPAECQVLICGVTILQDADILLKYKQADEDAVHVTAIFSVDRIIDSLAQGAGIQEMHASLDALEYFRAPHRDHAAASVRGRLEDDNEDVRFVAVQALAKLSPKGDPKNLLALRACLADRDADVRFVSIQALAKVADIGDTQVITDLKPSLHDPEFFVAEAAQTAMSDLAI